MLAGMLAIGGIGLIAAFLLGIASKVFYVPLDPLVQGIAEALPGANCGACGFAGCSSCARAIARARIRPDACLAGGPEVAVAVAGILGVTIELREPDVANLGCWYRTEEADAKFIYDGAKDCRAAMLLFGGSKLCEIGCLSLGTCVSACPFDAISLGASGLPLVNTNLCTGCGTCEQICPKGIIRLSSQTRSIQHLYTTDQCTAPCQRAWPAGIDIPAYISHITAGNYRQAIPVLLMFALLPFLTGILTGISVGFVGVSFPIGFALLETGGFDISHVVLAYGMGFVGVLLSPVHLCLLVTKDYFKAEFDKVYRSLLMPVVPIAAMVIFLFLIY